MRIVLGWIVMGLIMAGLAHLAWDNWSKQHERLKVRCEALAQEAGVKWRVRGNPANDSCQHLNKITGIWTTVYP